MLGAAMVGFGILTIVQRETIARLNASLLRWGMGKAGAREATRSTPKQFLIVGVIIFVTGLVCIGAALFALLNHSGPG